MFTKSDKEFMQQLRIEHPDIYERVVDLHNRSKDDLRNGCHDISNIIAIIYGSYQLISLKHPELASDARWTTLDSDIRSLISSMNSIGEYRYAASLEKTIEDADIYIKDTIDEICADLSIPVSQINMDISGISCRIDIDPDKIAFVLNSLLTNILQIDPDTNIKINAFKSDNNLYIKISDSVGGLSDNIAENLFRPFNTNKSSCIGMSLATSYQILLAHNGELTYTPNKENGSTFTLIIPVTD